MSRNHENQPQKNRETWCLSPPPSFRISEVSDHELGHGMGFYSRGETMSFIEFWNRDLMNEGQGMPRAPRQFDMSIPQNRQSVDEINKLPEYNPPQ
jgi:hypothetical protein